MRHAETGESFMQKLEPTRVRGRLWRLLTVAAVCGAASWSLAACATEDTEPADRDETCPAGLTACGASCADLDTDPAHCGACGTSCDGTPCQAGACIPACADGLTDCEGACVDLASDAAHCGACDAPCDAAATCVGATCQPCDDTNPECAPSCDGVQCAQGERCQAGRCQSICAPGELFCDQACIDGLDDEENCGACGFTCATGESCEAGSCECTPGVCGSCGVTDLGGATPQTVSGTTAGGVNALEPSCAPTSTREVVYSFTPATTGTYTFGASAAYDTILYLLDSGCAEVTCNDNSGISADPQLTANVAAGETVHVVVDGLQDEGPFTLTVSEAPFAPCPGGALGSAPQAVTGDTTNGADMFTGSCAFLPGSPDATFSFTAQSAGAYLFDSTGSGFPTVVYVLDGICGGAELGCNNDILGAKVLVDLAAGQTVTVVVDGNVQGQAGSYMLQVTELACPGQSIGALPATVTGDFIDYVDVFTPSCLFFSGADAMYAFTAPAVGTYAFDTFGSSVDTELYVLEGGCNGQELACNEEIAGNAAQVIVDLVANQTVVVGVDGDFGPGAFTLHAKALTCPDQVLGPPPQTVTGTTTDGAHQHEPLCAAAGGPEVTYAFTAPADGSYTFDTLGSSIDTKLYVRDTTCAGPELACADVFGATEQLTVDLVANQEVVVVVDGAGFQAGDYVLSVF
jgi:hypothetical protein